MKNSNIFAVVTTFQRNDSLKTSLDLLVSQSLPLTKIIVVDNADTPDTQKLVAGYGTKVNYVGSATNLGGAGGFALGILLALAQGAEYVWLADDDGHPENSQVLEILYTEMQTKKLAEISPLVCDINDPSQLAFPVRQGITWYKNRSELIANSAAENFIPQTASLFNGALFTKAAILTVGVPDLRLFIRGDEVEIYRRLTRSGIAFGTTLRTTYLHPAGTKEFIPILGGKIHAQYPDNTVKRYYTYRNRGYLLAQTGMRKLVWQEWIRFGWFFLVKKHDLAGFKKWVSLHKLGRKEQLFRYEESRK